MPSRSEVIERLQRGDLTTESVVDTLHAARAERDAQLLAAVRASGDAPRLTERVPPGDDERGPHA